MKKILIKYGILVLICLIFQQIADPLLCEHYNIPSIPIGIKIVYTIFTVIIYATVKWDRK